MIDLMSATQEAVFTALNAAVTAAPVHDHVKQDTPPPFVKIGPISLSNESTKNDREERFEVEVHSIYRGADRSQLLAMMHDVREALDGAALAVEGVEFWTSQFLSASASDAGPDGVTYAGISTFEVVAEPA